MLAARLPGKARLAVSAWGAEEAVLRRAGAVRLESCHNRLAEPSVWRRPQATEGLRAEALLGAAPE